MKKLREDCYFYYESQEMSAHVPNCSFDAQYEYGFCPCSENCKHYISKNEAHNLIKQITRCKDCRWYDEKISFCDNCHLPREQTFFCADGKKDGGQMKRPKETFWDSLSEVDLMEPMHHFED